MTETEAYCAELRTRIVAAYEESGNSLGWRLLYSPASVLHGAEIAFVGLNPGGSSRPAEHAEFAMAQGSAYVVEKWKPLSEAGKSPLQIQVCTLFQKLQVEPQRVLAGNIIPFRSPDWKCLKNRQQALQFGENLWNDILKRARPKLVIGMGREAILSLSRILGAQNTESIPVNWGKITGTRAPFPGGLLVGLPHLSKYKIVTRPDSKAALQKLFGEHLSG